tara:strand:- start:180 stop:395 length:216 start_codon:yes stop_codon:yes gene_type:complete
LVTDEALSDELLSKAFLYAEVCELGRVDLSTAGRVLVAELSALAGVESRSGAGSFAEVPGGVQVRQTTLGE